nr:reverse transcriptase domain-containing protein [Tanacetum cinerariifolium]
MQTRSSSRLVINPSSNPTPSTNMNPKGRNRRHSRQRIEDFNLEELSPLIVMMADPRTMAQLLQTPTKGDEDTIVVPAITADNFELKHGLLTFVQNKQFFVHDKEDPHAHVRYFNKITSTLKFLNVLNTSIKLMLFPFSLEGAARIWLEKEPPRSIFTWDDLVLKFINQLFPPSKTTNLRNEITYFQQCFDESFSEAWDRFKDLLQACPHHDVSELHQLDTFYNALNSKDQDSLNFAAGGNFLDKMPRECLAIIESKYKVGYSRNKPVVAKVSMNTSTFGISLDVAKLKDMVRAILLDKKSKKSISCSYESGRGKFTSTSSSGTLPSNTIAKLRSDLKAITTRSGVSYDGPQILPSTFFLPKVVKSESLIFTSEPVTSLISEPVIAPVSAPKPNPKTLIPYPSRRNDERDCKKANNQIQKFYQIFKDMSFEISFADALILMPKFALTLKALIGNKEKLSEMARTPLNEHCSTVLLKKLPEKLGDPGKFLIPCDFPGMTECLALADLGATINLMPFSVWKRLSLPDLTPTCMTLELADRLISRPVGVAEDVYVKTGRALIDVFEGELTLHVGKEAITFNLDQTLRYSANYRDMTAKRIDVIDMACEEYSQEILCFFDVILSGNPTPYYDPIVSTTSSTLTPFENNDFLLEEVDAFLAIEDHPSSLEFYQPYLDTEGGILLLEAFLNDDPSLPPQNQGNYLPEVRKELKICEAKSDKSLVDEPLKVELKDLPPTLNMHSWKRYMMAIFYDMIEKTMEVFMDDFSVFGNSFQSLVENHTSWLDKLDDALWAFRTSYKTPIGCTPYKLVYGKACQINKLNELRDQAYENSLIYKENTKRLHESKIKNRVFNIGDRVLLFNSRLKIFTSKLKSRWCGPFTISQVYPYGTVKLSQPDGLNFKFNGHHLKHYFGEDIPKLVVPDLQTFSKDY